MPNEDRPVSGNRKDAGAGEKTSAAVGAIRQRVDQLWARAADRLGCRLPECRVRVDLKGLAAGRCLFTRGGGATTVTLRFNARSLTEPWLLDDTLAETVPHEVAHGAIGVWAGLRRRRVRPHGPEWLELCRALGGSGRTTHELPLNRARRHREYEYRLTDGRCIWLGPVQHRRLQEGRARYFHGRLAVVPNARTGRWQYRE